MATKVMYEGPRSRDNESSILYVDGFRFTAGFATEVNDDELLTEIREGSDRLKGYKLEVADDEQVEEEQVEDQPDETPVDPSPRAPSPEA